MASTSVTGTGPGSSEGSDSGRKEHSMGTSRLIGVRHMAAGIHAFVAPAPASVTLPLLPGVVSDYVVMAVNATAATVVLSALTFPGGTSTLITFTGLAPNDVVHWTIIKAGLSI